MRKFRLRRKKRSPLCPTLSACFGEDVEDEEKGGQLRRQATLTRLSNGKTISIISSNISKDDGELRVFTLVVGVTYFLGAPKHLYNWLCPMVCLSVCLSLTHSFDDPHGAPYRSTWPYFRLHAWMRRNTVLVKIWVEFQKKCSLSQWSDGAIPLMMRDKEDASYNRLNEKE